MPTTSNGIWYPDDNTKVDNLAGLFSTMASSINTAINSVGDGIQPVTYTDTGWTLNGITAAANFSTVTDANGNTTSVKGGMRRWGPMVELRFRIKYTGPLLRADANGNLADKLCATISNTSMRPSGNVYSGFNYGPGKGTGGIRVEPDGTINIVDLYPNAEILTNFVCQIYATYFTG